MAQILTTNVNNETINRNIVSLDEYKKLTGSQELQQIIESAVTGALSSMHLDNLIPDSPDSTKKMKRCAVDTELGRIWVQGTTIPEMCLDFHRKMMEKAKVEMVIQEPTHKTPLFEDYAREWWQTFGKKNVSFATIKDYETNLNKHVIPYFTGKRLDEITTKDVQEFYNARRDYSASTCRHWRTILYGIFDSAIEDGLLEKNPAKSKRLTMSSKKTERLPISREEALDLESKLALLEGTDQSMLAILLFTGARRGEMLGLQWGDIDFDAKLIHINRQISIVSNRAYVKTTKSKAGVRSVPLLPELEKILLANKPENAEDTDFIVSGKIPSSERSFRNSWERIQKKIDMDEKITPHVLRHTFLTELEASQQTDLKTLQSIAGHSKITMTMNTYVHSREENVQKVSTDVAGIYHRPA